MDTRFSVAIHVLATISEEQDRELSSQDLAVSVGTNASHIRRVIGQVKAAGLIESSRGRSGYRLTRLPSDISLLDIYRAVHLPRSPTSSVMSRQMTILKPGGRIVSLGARPMRPSPVAHRDLGQATHAPALVMLVHAVGRRCRRVTAFKSEFVSATRVACSCRYPRRPEDPPTLENAMTSFRHGLAATTATVLLALALTAVSPAVANAVTSDGALQDPGTYATSAADPDAEAAAPEPSASDPSPSSTAAPSPSSTAAPSPATAPSPESAPTPSPTPEQPAPEPTTGSWSKDSVGWKYVLPDGTVVTNQVKEIDGVTYAFDATGRIARGWYRDPHGSWYLSSDDGVRTGWQRDGGRWYYLESSGVMRTGWVRDGGTWYYLGASGAMVTGWQRDGGTWYYLGASGAMVTGWQRDGGKWYYFEPSGAMATGWQVDRGTWYYFWSSGAMATGWVQDGGHWFHLSSSGAMTTGWLHSGEWYYLDPANGGAIATGWLSIGGRWNYFDAWDGFWVTDRAGFAADWEYARTLYSPTNYLIVVDSAAPHCMTFYWRDGAWQPHHDWPCSVGAPSTPTVRGTFSVGTRGRSFGEGFTVYWWTQFHHDYLFHSILYNQGTYTVQDGTLGGHVSHGCVRMRIQDAKWIYDNVPSRTTVVVY